MKPLSQGQIRIVFRNVAVLVFLALPTAVLSLVPNELLLTGSTGLSTVADVLTPYFVAVLPVGAGGVLHQLIAARVPAGWSSTRRRLAMMATSPLAGVALPLFMEFSYLARFALPIVLGLLVYNAFSKLIPVE